MKPIRFVNGQLWCIQLTEEFATERDAWESLRHQETQIDYLGGRVLPCAMGEKVHRLQAFFEDVPDPKSWLPHGCRRVVLLESQARSLGVRYWQRGGINATE